MLSLHRGKGLIPGWGTEIPFASQSGFPGATSVKEPTCQCRRLGIQSLSWEHPLEEDMGICILAWRIPWTEEPGGLQSVGSQRVRHSLSDLARTHTGNYVIKSFLLFHSLVFLNRYAFKF